MEDIHKQISEVDNIRKWHIYGLAILLIIYLVLFGSGVTVWITRPLLTIIGLLLGIVVRRYHKREKLMWEHFKKSVDYKKPTKVYFFNI